MCVNVIKCVYLKYIYDIYIYTVYIYSVYIYTVYIYIQYIIPKFRHRQQLNPPSRSSWHRLRPMFKGSRLRWDENFDRRKRGENHGRLPRSRRKHECSYECFIMWFIICLYYIYVCVCFIMWFIMCLYLLFLQLKIQDPTEHPFGWSMSYQLGWPS